MQITYANGRLEKILTTYGKTKKQYGEQLAIKIHQRLDQISAADTIEILITTGLGKCHALTGSRKGQYAMHLNASWRIIFSVSGETIQIACIEEITDYH